MPNNLPPWPACYEKSLARRVEVEQELYDRAAGTLPLPTADDCRRMADRLGCPDLAAAIAEARE